MTICSKRTIDITFFISFHLFDVWHPKLPPIKHNLRWKFFFCTRENVSSFTNLPKWLINFSIFMTLDYEFPILSQTSNISNPFDNHVYCRNWFTFNFECFLLFQAFLKLQNKSLSMSGFNWSLLEFGSIVSPWIKQHTMISMKEPSFFQLDNEWILRVIGFISLCIDALCQLDMTVYSTWRVQLIFECG